MCGILVDNSTIFDTIHPHFKHFCRFVILSNNATNCFAQLGLRREQAAASDKIDKST